MPQNTLSRAQLFDEFCSSLYDVWVLKSLIHPEDLEKLVNLPSTLNLKTSDADITITTDFKYCCDFEMQWALIKIDFGLDEGGKRKPKIVSKENITSRVLKDKH